MPYDGLDIEELLRLALEAINDARDVEALAMLRTVLERQPDNLHAQYLLAVQHAQLGMFERAEARFRTVLAAAPDFIAARFQLAQLLVMAGSSKDTADLLSGVAAQTGSIGAYARALIAAAADDLPRALHELDIGLALPQWIPPLAGDMQRLREQLWLRQHALPG